MTTAQTLTLVGLVFEFLSVIVLTYEMFYGYYRWLDTVGKTTSQKLLSRQVKAVVSLGFLVIGMLLQALGLYL